MTQSEAHTLQQQLHINSCHSCDFSTHHYSIQHGLGLLGLAYRRNVSKKRSIDAATDQQHWMRCWQWMPLQSYPFAILRVSAILCRGQVALEIETISHQIETISLHQYQSFRGAQDITILHESIFLKWHWSLSSTAFNSSSNDAHSDVMLLCTISLQAEP